MLPPPLFTPLSGDQESGSFALPDLDVGQPFGRTPSFRSATPQYTLLSDGEAAEQAGLEMSAIGQQQMITPLQTSYHP